MDRLVDDDNSAGSRRSRSVPSPRQSQASVSHDSSYVGEVDPISEMLPLSGPAQPARDQYWSETRRRIYAKIQEEEAKKREAERAKEAELDSDEADVPESSGPRIPYWRGFRRALTDIPIPGVIRGQESIGWSIGIFHETCDRALELYEQSSAVSSDPSVELSPATEERTGEEVNGDPVLKDENNNILEPDMLDEDDADLDDPLDLTDIVQVIQISQSTPSTDEGHHVEGSLLKIMEGQNLDDFIHELSEAQDLDEFNCQMTEDENVDESLIELIKRCAKDNESYQEFNGRGYADDTLQELDSYSALDISPICRLETIFEEDEYEESESKDALEPQVSHPMITDQSYSFPIQVQETPGVSLRATFLSYAEIAEESRRLEELAFWMVNVASFNCPLNEHEWLLLAKGFRGSVLKRRKSLKTTGGIEKGERKLKRRGTYPDDELNHYQLVKDYRAKIRQEILDLSTLILALLDEWLLPHALEERPRPIHTVGAYHKMRADHLRYLAEIKKEERESLGQRSLEAYLKAKKYFSKVLNPIHPHRLSTALCLSCLYSEILGLHQIAAEEADGAWELADNFLKQKPRPIEYPGSYELKIELYGNFSALEERCGSYYREYRKDSDSDPESLPY